MEESAGNWLGWVGVMEVGDGVIGIGGVGIGLLIRSLAHFLFNPTLILVAAVGLIINTQSDVEDCTFQSPFQSHKHMSQDG